MLTIEIQKDGNWKRLDTAGARIEIEALSPLFTDKVTPIAYSPAFSSTIPDTPRNRQLLNNPFFNAQRDKWQAFPVRIAFGNVPIIKGMLEPVEGLVPCQGIPVQITDDNIEKSTLTLSEAAGSFPLIDMLATAPSIADYLNDTIVNPDAPITFPTFLNSDLYSPNLLHWTTDVLGDISILSYTNLPNTYFSSTSTYIGSTPHDHKLTPFPRLNYFLDQYAKYQLGLYAGLQGVLKNTPEIVDIILYNNFMLHADPYLTQVLNPIAPARIFTDQCTVEQLLADVRLMFGIVAYQRNGAMQSFFAKDALYFEPTDITHKVSPPIEISPFVPQKTKKICWGDDDHDLLDGELDRFYLIPYDLISTLPTRWDAPPSNPPYFGSDYYYIEATNEILQFDEQANQWRKEWGSKIPCYYPSQTIQPNDNIERAATGVPMFQSQNRLDEIPSLFWHDLTPYIKNKASSYFKVVNTGGQRPDTNLQLNPFGLRYTVFRGLQPQHPDSPGAGLGMYPLANYRPYNAEGNQIGNLYLTWEYLYHNYIRPFEYALAQTDIETRRINLTPLDILNYDWAIPVLIKSETPQKYITKKLRMTITADCIDTTADFIRISPCS